MGGPRARRRPILNQNMLWAVDARKLAFRCDIILPVVLLKILLIFAKLSKLLICLLYF